MNSEATDAVVPQDPSEAVASPSAGLVVGRDGTRTRLLLTAVGTAWLALALYSLARVVGFWPDYIIGMDFLPMWTAGQMVTQGVGSGMFDVQVQMEFQNDIKQQIATIPWLQDAQVYNNFVNPPVLALVFAPLSWIPIPLAYILWASVSFAIQAFAIALPLRRRAGFWKPVALMLSFAAVPVTLLEGQVNGLFLLAFSLGLVSICARRPVLGGIFLGFLFLKPQYSMVLLLVFLLKRRWPELLGMCGTGVVLGGVSLVMVGGDGMVMYGQMMSRVGSYLPPTGFPISPTAMANWRALLMNLWPGIPVAEGTILMYGLGALTVFGSLLIWRGPWEPSSPRFPIQMLVVGMASIIASPHSHFHGMVLLLAPLALAVGRTRETSAVREWLYPLLFGGYVLGLAAWLFRSLSWVFVPYFIVVFFLLLYGDRGFARRL